MDSRSILASVLFLFVLVSCKEGDWKTGNIARVDYQGAKIEGGEWVQVDSFRFVHIEKRSGARGVKYPIPSNEVKLDSTKTKKRKRDYNPKTFPLYIAKNIQKINKRLPKNKEYVITSRFLMSYEGELRITKKDSSKIKIGASKNYDAKVDAKDR